MKCIRNPVDAGRNERKSPLFLTDPRITNTLVIGRYVVRLWPPRIMQAPRSSGSPSLSCPSAGAAPAAGGAAV